MMTLAYLASTIALTSTLAVAPGEGQASADEEIASPMPRDAAPGSTIGTTRRIRRHEQGYRGALGTKLIGAFAFEGGGADPLGGLGVVFEFGLWENRLAVELAGAWLASPEETEVPIDLLLKANLPGTRVFHPFIGAGPMIVASHVDGEPALHPGGLASIGAHFWGRGKYGFLVEFDYGIVAKEGAPAQEFEIGAGMVYRF